MIAHYLQRCASNWSLTRLARLILASNLFESIPVPTHPPILSKLTHLSLSCTNISKWSSIDSLNLWCPDLESLSLNGIPLLEGATSDARDLSPRGTGFRRQPGLIVLRCTTCAQIHNWAESGNRLSLPVSLSSEPLMEPPSVHYVHGLLLPDTQRLKPYCLIHSFSMLKISPRHRVDAELFYLSRIARESYLSDAARHAAHPRWAELCERKSSSTRKEHC